MNNDRQKKQIAPAFQFLANDFLAESVFLSMEGRGVYITLKAYCWIKGGLPNDMRLLGKLCLLPEETFEEIWEREIKDLFEVDGNRIYLADLENQRIFQEEKREKAKASAESRWKNADAMRMHNRTHNRTEYTSTSTSTSKKKDNSNELSKKETKAGCRIPENFELSDEMILWAKEETPDISVSLETEKFKNYWKASSNKNSVKRDWIAAWRYWLLTAQQQQPGEVKNGSNKKYSNKVTPKRTNADVASESADFYANYPN